MPSSSDDKKKTTAKKKTTKTAKSTATKKTATKKTATKKTATKKTATAKKAEPAVSNAAEPAKPAAKVKKAVVGKKLRVRQIRSGVGRRQDFRDTIRALGIKHHQGEVVVTATPAIEGMLRKVRHMIQVTPEE